jgi:hypothetical protein
MMKKLMISSASCYLLLIKDDNQGSTLPRASAHMPIGIPIRDGGVSLSDGVLR